MTVENENDSGDRYPIFSYIDSVRGLVLTLLNVSRIFFCQLRTINDLKTKPRLTNGYIKRTQYGP